MASRRGFILALLVTVLAGVVAGQLGWLGPSSTPLPTRPRPSPPPAFQSAWASEQDWVVDTITRDVRQMIAFAATGSAPDEPASALGASTVSFVDHIFSPGTYAPLAVEWLSRAGGPETVHTSSAGEDARLLASLLDLRAGVLVRESEKVSRRLAEEPRDAAAHERAALLLGAFALRERARRYGDVRPALCRMTAHLTLASALRGGAPTELAGRVGEALLDTLAGRQRSALSHLDALESRAGSRAERAWVRALRLRNTGDWRMARDAKNLTLLEKLEEFAALAMGLNELEALDWLERQGPPETIPDWGKLALHAGASVQSHNRFAPAAAAMELAEAAEVLGPTGGESFEDLDGLLGSLDARPAGFLERDAGGNLRPAVLGRGLWTDRAERHIVFALVAESFRLSAMLGQAGAQRSFVEDSRAFSRLELFPLFLRNVAVDAELYGPAMAAVRELARRSPERITGGMWVLLRTKVDYAPLPTDLPDEKAWFRPALLPGTLLDYHYRGDLLPELEALNAETLARLRALAPYDVDLAQFAVDRQPAETKTVAGLVPVYGDLAVYHTFVMNQLAYVAWYDPPEFRRRQGALCELDAERCFRLGYRLAELGFPDEAAEAYQKGFDRARDRVFAANECQWLVQHYFERGELARAEKLARRAAATGAQAALLVLAKLMEQVGRLDEAEALYRQTFETYDDADFMAGFYYRQARVAGNEAYEGRLRDALALALPSGLEPLDRAALPPEPTDGVVVRRENDNTKRYGIKWGHVIVGLDGFRVRNSDEYDLVWALSHSPRMKLVVWRGTSYDDIEAELWDRRFRFNLEDLAPKK